MYFIGYDENYVRFWTVEDHYSLKAYLQTHNLLSENTKPFISLTSLHRQNTQDSFVTLFVLQNVLDQELYQHRNKKENAETDDTLNLKWCSMLGKYYKVTLPCYRQNPHYFNFMYLTKILLKHQYWQGSRNILKSKNKTAFCQVAHIQALTFAIAIELDWTYCSSHPSPYPTHTKFQSIWQPQLEKSTLTFPKSYPWILTLNRSKLWLPLDALFLSCAVKSVINNTSLWSIYEWLEVFLCLQTCQMHNINVFLASFVDFP